MHKNQRLRVYRALAANQGFQSAHEAERRVVCKDCGAGGLTWKKVGSKEWALFLMGIRHECSAKVTP